MIVTVNLAKGAIAMSRKKVIVKRLNAIQNFGAMDVLCTDKTGTLTQDRIILKRASRHPRRRSRAGAAICLSEQPLPVGLEKPARRRGPGSMSNSTRYSGSTAAIREDRRNSFDFSRRRLSVMVSREDGKHVLICKGAVEEDICGLHPLRNRRRDAGTSTRAILRQAQGGDRGAQRGRVPRRRRRL